MNPSNTTQTITVPRPNRIIAPLEDWRVLAISGPQQEKFTKGLLSNKVVGIQPGQGRPGLPATRQPQESHGCGAAAQSDGNGRYRNGRGWTVRHEHHFADLYGVAQAG